MDDYCSSYSSLKCSNLFELFAHTWSYQSKEHSCSAWALCFCFCLSRPWSDTPVVTFLPVSLYLLSQEKTNWITISPGKQAGVRNAHEPETKKKPKQPKNKTQGAGSAVYVVMLLKAAATLKRPIHGVDHHIGSLISSLALLFPKISIMAEEGSEYKQNIISRDNLQVGPFGKRTPKA